LKAIGHPPFKRDLTRRSRYENGNVGEVIAEDDLDLGRRNARDGRQRLAKSPLLGSEIDRADTLLPKVRSEGWIPTDSTLGGQQRGPDRDRNRVILGHCR
jgi:hypothetical protein